MPDLEPISGALVILPALLLGYLRGPRGTLLGVFAALLSGTATNVASGGALFSEAAAWLVSLATLTAVLTVLGARFRQDLVRAETMALTDNLTRLPNRRHALTFLESHFAAAERGAVLCVVLFDLDHFKQFNDELGHGTGDLALRAFADVLRDNTRRMNLSARMGGEEFLCVLCDSSAEGASTFAHRVRRALGSVRFSDHPLTASAGVAVYHPAMKDVDDLLAAADHALYRAKRDGRDCVRVFGSEVEPTRTGEDAPNVPPPTLGPVGADRSVLVVHTEGERRRALLEMLREDGFTALPAETRTDAIGVIDAPPDLAIVDLKLGEGSGARLCQTLKARWPHVQVLALSEPLDEHSIVMAVEAQADRYLIQPVAAVALRQALSEMLAARRPLHGRRQGERLGARQGLLLQMADEIEAREEYGWGHGRRVETAAKILGDHWVEGGAPPPDPDALGLGSRLHDLGRASVPAALLNKVLPLTVEEVRLIHRHPVVGQSLVATLLPGSPAAAVVRWHAERWDGSGYPDGLVGRSIPLEARICAVADALDAMTTYRRYRPPLTFAEAVQTIREEAGRHFDPAVVALLERAAPEIERRFEALREPAVALPAG
ncbi:MAG: diguanylate cyclase [Gemmatimonadota bacterium]